MQWSLLAACACGHFGPGTNSFVMRGLFAESIAAVPPNYPFNLDAPRAARRLTARWVSDAASALS